jgi:hypothetical protein
MEHTGFWPRLMSICWSKTQITYNKTKETLLEGRMEVIPEITADRTMYIFISHHHNIFFKLIETTRLHIVGEYENRVLGKYLDIGESK